MRQVDGVARKEMRAAMWLDRGADGGDGAGGGAQQILCAALLAVEHVNATVLSVRETILSVNAAVLSMPSWIVKRLVSMGFANAAQQLEITIETGTVEAEQHAEQHRKATKDKLQGSVS